MTSKNPVLGTRGDFVTSPEISQVFGEIVGVWLVSQWMNSARAPIRLLELGPGRGTLMQDVLRVLCQFRVVKSAVKEIHLVESSSAMKLAQEKTLQPFAQENNWKLHWHNSVDDIPRCTETYTMILAHEFFDALPFHLLEKTHHGWQEVLITSSDVPLSTLKISKSESLSGSVINVDSPRFKHVLSPSPTAASTLLGLSSNRFQKLAVGSRIEISPAAFKIAYRLGQLVESNSDKSTGCGLVVDYGGEKAYGSSFRAFKNHKIVDVFHRPGECDLTVNVDFAYLKEALSAHATTLGPLSQASFLTRMGIQMRVEALKRGAQSEDRKHEIERGVLRLINLTGMGTQYQVMGFTSSKVGELKPEERWPFVDLENLNTPESPQ
ncbi:hypothetical protein NLI96_g2081 [Meripilus lineatus]|uniref:Protein arginine methyltransferase NDUFAF7 n=1 Tax=Meripilus lineatus TaxID=2056292 RepID=A0AAD5YMB6_9APHY|nr:hypothetical protein NLI96_g2081 [Physisporinus lineatus]